MPKPVLADKDNAAPSNAAPKASKQAPNDFTMRAYLEPIDQSLWDVKPLPIRKTTAKDQTVPYLYCFQNVISWIRIVCQGNNEKEELAQKLKCWYVMVRST